jgi:hypothetical protein
MTINLRHIIAGAISALLLVGFAPAFTSPAHAEMTPEQAGAYYLAHECRNSLALYLFVHEMTRRGSIRFADVEKRFPRFKREARKLGAAQTRFATRLLGPPDVWPAQVATSVQAVVDAGFKSGRFLARAGQAPTPRSWWRTFWKANGQITKVEKGKAEIRVLLNLSPTEC